MVGQVEEPTMRWEHGATAHELVGLDGLLRTEMPVRPPAPVGSDLDHRHIERSETIADISETRKHPGVSRVAGAVLGSDEREARPEGPILSKHCGSPRWVRRRGRDNGKAPDRRTLPPVELDDLHLRNAPVGEMGADTQRYDEGGLPILHRRDRLVIEVV